MLCCELVSVPNDERTNGVKILRKKDSPVDLSTELTAVTNRAAISPEVLRRNILYAVTVIQGGDPVLDRRSSSEEAENDTLAPLPILTVQPPPPTSPSEQEHPPEPLLLLNPDSPPSTDHDSDTLQEQQPLLVVDTAGSNRFHSHISLKLAVSTHTHPPPYTFTSTRPATHILHLPPLLTFQHFHISPHF
ncbi:hypothetical protein Fcan01_21463 [Folsomia candida]|uniref:Uncharacterized protein n=1 Tax=Folsomia candida TaxID=158441 RepID=A0A226DH77_FOLCA|nr:hypothetical protein Fcan01_21463 [Folsomia candida]